MQDATWYDSGIKLFLKSLELCERQSCSQALRVHLVWSRVEVVEDLA